MENEKFDPWGTSLIRDYEHLFTEFGMQKVDDSILARVGNESRLFRRGIIFAHRDFDRFLGACERGEKAAAMSGIKPTGDFHLGSKLTAEELIFFQKRFGAKVFYCVADLEAYADNGQSIEESAQTAVSNVADLLALGLDHKNACIYKQSEEKRVMNLAYIFGKRTTMAILGALYGERNIGLYFSVLTQAGDILLPQLREFDGPKMTVVPVGVDQDPHIRFVRDIAQKFHPDYGFLSPAATYHKFFRSLGGDTKMSKREPMGMLTLGDEPELAKKKIMNAFSGGRATVEEQKKLGGEIEKCVVYELCLFHFIENDGKLAAMRKACTSGRMMCGECKAKTAEIITSYLKKHQKKKSKMMKKAEKLLRAD